MKKIILTSAMLILVNFHTASFGEGCSDYPYTDGINAEDVPGGVKILATESATVTFDDIDSVRDAKDEATLLAKAAIAKFLTEGIAIDEQISKAVNETKSMSGASKAAQRNETIERVKQLRNSASERIRGAMVLADCYTKGVEVRVSVGIKPETIAASKTLSNGINSSINEGKTNSNNSNSLSAPSSQQGIPSYSNTNRLNNF